VTQISAAYLWLLNALRALSGVVVFGIFLLIVVDVGIRMAGPMIGVQPWIYSSGVVEYGLLWFAMLAAPWLTRVKGHVFIDRPHPAGAARPPAHPRQARVSHLRLLVARVLLFFVLAPDRSDRLG